MTPSNIVRLGGKGNLAVQSVAGEPRIRDLDLAARLGFAEPRMIRRLIKRHEASLAELGVCYTVEQTSGFLGGRPATEYYLNRKQAIFITAKSETAEATDITIEIIERFDAYEKGASAPQIDVRNPAQLTKIAIQLIEVNRELQDQVQELAPKADALDRIASADGSLCITDAAKALQIPPKSLFSYLQANGWIYRRPGGGHYLGYQVRVNAGLLEHKVETISRPDGSEKMTEQVRITPKGLTKLSALLNPIAAE